MGSLAHVAQLLGPVLGFGSLIAFLGWLFSLQKKTIKDSLTINKHTTSQNKDDNTKQETASALDTLDDTLAEDQDPSPSVSLSSSTASDVSTSAQSPTDTTSKTAATKTTPACEKASSDLGEAADEAEDAANDASTFQLVGLQNQGATCYLNSLLQTLCHISTFRRAIYRIPHDTKDQIAAALRRVFYNLQYGGSTVCTNDLLKSFGWNTSDAYIQQDVQELTRVLLERLEMSIKSSITSLFEGKIKNYIKCMHVKYESSHIESFYDLQLTINSRECPNLYRSFKHYIKEELLTGSNRYDAGADHGLQDARKGCVFTQLPPVLMLHLKRFEFNHLSGNMYKINDFYEFDKDIDLSSFVERDEAVPQEQHKQDNQYRLFSVLVHSGTVNSGHYYVYINLPSFLPSESSGGDIADKWYKFNDETVTEVSEDAATVGNYGGKMWSAYMLVYIRKKDMARIVSSYKTADMSKMLRAQIVQEQSSRCSIM